MVEASNEVLQEQSNAPQKITVEVAPTKDVGEAGGDCDINVRISLPEGNLQRQPTDFCCLVDTSGSMCSAAMNENCDKEANDDGFSILDIVKHACNAVMNMLNEEDRMSLVIFHDPAEVVFPLTNMSEEKR
jgi:hypothetical protein